jgi:uncharacterized repeat protein (TIGR01451 family)
MKNLCILFILFSISVITVQAQLTGINPNQGVHGQTLTTTITANNIFIQTSSPSGNISQINLIKGVDVINVFDIFNGFNFTTTVMDPNTVVTDVTIPLTAVAGLYDLEVITGDPMYPWQNPISYSLPGVFTVIPPDGYVSGTAYKDLNKDGVKDVGEPGLSNLQVRLLPLNYILYTDANGNYNFPVANGSYSVVLIQPSNPYLFLTTSNDTLGVTINSSNSTGNDFGLKDALVSVTPAIGYQGVTSTHQFVSEEPIFHPGPPNNGNVSSVYFTSTGTNFSVSNTFVTVIDSYTVQISVAVPVSATITTYTVRIYTNSGFAGNHYLYGQFNVQAAPSYVSGRVFFDQNMNKIYDSGEPGINGAKTTLMPANSIAFSDNAGNYLFGTLGGQQTVSYASIIAGLTLFTDSASYTFNATGNITGKDFGLISTLPDYSIDVQSLYVFARCNSNQWVTIPIRNNSNVTYDANVWFKHTTAMTYQSASLPPTLVTADTIFWTVPAIEPYTVTNLYVLMHNPSGGTLQLEANATSLDAGGVEQLSDSYSHSYNVFCAFDPNDKQVTPEGIFVPHYTLMSDTLEYQIRFQNTGTDTAFNVVVLDTLDAQLDLNSFEILGSSHSVQTEIKNNGAVAFRFNNILLPDSNVNEPLSHGYVRYKIRPLSGLPDTTVITNTAHIFFDFNPDVVTNSTLNTLVYILPTGINEINSLGAVLFFPNPLLNSSTLMFENPNAELFTVAVYDITGKIVSPGKQTTGNKFIIDKGKIANGIYFYKLTNTESQLSKTGKFIIE